MDRITIEVDGTPRPFHFGVGFVGAILDTMNIGFDEFQIKVAQNPFSMVPLMMHESHKLACLLDETEPTLTRFDVIRFIDANGGIAGEPVAKFLQGFRASQTRDVPAKKTRPKARKTPAKN